MSNITSGDGKPGNSELPANDVRLGAQAQRWVGRTLVASSIVTLAMALYVTSQVPLDTTMVYNRLSRQFDVPLLGMLGFPCLLLIMWAKGRKDRSGLIPARERYVLWSLGLLFFGGSIVGQSFLAAGFLESGN
jgi:cytochrome bd-type quinol oxidase subunit 2